MINQLNKIGAQKILHMGILEKVIEFKIDRIDVLLDQGDSRIYRVLSQNNSIPNPIL